MGDVFARGVVADAADYEMSKACGAYALVRAASGASVTVRITNECPAPCEVSVSSDRRQLPRTDYNRARAPFVSRAGRC